MTDDNTADHLKTWQTYKQQGISGEFKMEHDIGAALAARCDTLVQDLYQAKRDAQGLEFLGGYGGLPSAQDLQRKYQQKAVGGAEHDPNDNAVARIQQHIEIVETMRDAYLAAIGQLQNVDQYNSQQMNGQTDQVR
ncbi:hypothetical protein [Nocardia farcinica]|uniref:hypothetical protein n=1 Tax=Nocardia farcinica TaxID=37329 RepID=UPI000BF822E9|nr:hypothetical protein [Nocardia farcinica]MBF6269781.1 hypothetical protein [Nocardia farcinica]MCZ9328798.1 hypothetical protein [Nocardia farcinica]PFX01391.1 hypothetical protein CJ469_03506 [Nocardia farcinica]PFX07481.1 hypothetical protein CJ468_03665 [Nocardia farcinica]